MRIAYCIRPGFVSGGDGVQAIKTKEAVEALRPDISIEILTSPDDLIKGGGYDLVHIFNFATSELTNLFFEKAVSLNIAIVSSPIFWDYSYSLIPLPQWISFRKKFITEPYVLRHRGVNKLLSCVPIPKIKSKYHNVSKKFRRSMYRFIEKSLYILPNSQEEGEKCLAFSRCPKSWKSKIRVVYNGVDAKDVRIVDKKEFFLRYNIPENYVLQVGRVEYLKNALNLVSALMDYPEIPIVLLGSTVGYGRYVSKIKSLANIRGNVFFISEVPHEEVYSFFYYAKVHVLLSMRESPGLVSLEALSQGCPIIVSDARFCPVETYFKEQCEVVNPFDKTMIQNAVLKSMQKQHSKVDLSRFSWSEVARSTINVYEEVWTNVNRVE